MQKHRITTINDSHYEAFRQIYSVSFPPHEQRNVGQQSAALVDDRYFLDVYLSGVTMVAFAAYWLFEGYLYIEHFAVNPDLRGRNIGTRVLEDLKERYKDMVVLLEIDPLSDEISRSRLRFYERLGFCRNDYRHHHPPYDPACPPHELIVLTAPRKITPQEYAVFQADLSRIMAK